jgi:hypothetical protein
MPKGNHDVPSPVYARSTLLGFRPCCNRGYT